jgi:hypothetical protein
MIGSPCHIYEPDLARALSRLLVEPETIDAAQLADEALAGWGVVFDAPRRGASASIRAARSYGAGRAVRVFFGGWFSREILSAEMKGPIDVGRELR